MELKALKSWNSGTEGIKPLKEIRGKPELEQYVKSLCLAPEKEQSGTAVQALHFRLKKGKPAENYVRDASGFGRAHPGCGTQRSQWYPHLLDDQLEPGNQCHQQGCLTDSLLAFTSSQPREGLPQLQGQVGSSQSNGVSVIFIRRLRKSYHSAFEAVLSHTCV